MKIWPTLNLSTLGNRRPWGNTEAEAKEAVLAAEQAFVDAMTNADKAALERFLADDLVYVHSSSKAETKAEVLQAISSVFATYQSIEFRDSTVRQYGDVVITTHKAAINTKQSGVANLLATHVWVKNKGGWQFASRHAARLPQERC